MVLSPISPCSSIGCCSCFLILDGEFLLPLHIFSSFLVCFRLPLVLFPVLGWWKLPTRGHYMKKAYCFSCVFSVACIVCVCTHTCVRSWLFSFSRTREHFCPLHIVLCVSFFSAHLPLPSEWANRAVSFIYLPPTAARDVGGAGEATTAAEEFSFFFPAPRITSRRRPAKVYMKRVCHALSPIRGIRPV